MKSLQLFSFFFSVFFFFLKRILHFLLPYFRKYRWAFLFTTLNTAGLMFYTFWLVNKPLVLSHEYAIMSEVLHIKHAVWHHLKKTPPIENRFLLLDVSRNAQLIYLDNDSLTNEIITDRKKLAETLEILENNSDKLQYIICDILFDRPLGNDSLSVATDRQLSAVLKRLDEKNKIIVPVDYFRKNDSVSSCIFDIQTGLSQYNPSFNQSFYKYRFIEGKAFKQIPLLLHEYFHKKEARHFSFLGLDLFQMDKELHLNRIIPDYQYYAEDLIPDKNYFYLGEFDEYLIGDSRPIVLIGAFERDDFHNTLIGKMPGPLIIVNLLIAMENGATRISWLFLLILFISYFLISYNTLYKQLNRQQAAPPNESENKNWIRKGLDKAIYWLAHHRNFLMLLTLMLISLLFFHHYIYFLSVATYLLLLELSLKGVRLIRNRKK